MSIRSVVKGLAMGTAAFLFFWFVLAKVVARAAARWGYSGPCPASVAWLVDNPLRRHMMRPVLGWVGIKPGEQVLELGPGPGAFTVDAARLVGPHGRLLAVDIQPQMIAQVEQRLRQAGLHNVETHVASAYDLPVEDKSMDRAFLVSVLPEIPDPGRALAELRRVLRPGGVLSITAEFTDPDYQFAGETERLLRQNGFTPRHKHGNWWRYTANFEPTVGWKPGSEYYVTREKALLREYDSALRRVLPLLIQRYGESFVNTVTPAARAEFQRLIPQLPYIGGKSNHLTFDLVSSAWFVALYRAMQDQGKDLDELGPLLLDLYRALLESLPGWLRRLRGWWAFTPMFTRRLQRRAQRSQDRRFPGDWVYTFVPKNGHDYGVDYTDCGVYKFCQEQGVTELMPYLCSVDFIMSEQLGLGLERTTALAAGGERCNFRFQRGRATSWPAGLQEQVLRSLPPEIVALLRHPSTGETLHYESDLTADGHFQEWLAADVSGERFPIEDGIPIFVQEQDITGLNRKYQTFYQVTAPLYDFFVRLYGFLWGKSETFWRQEFLSQLEIKPGDRILEVSVGTGGNLRLLPEAARYIGLDLTKGMLRQCQRNLRRWQRTATLINGSAERLPFDNALFDVVFHVGGINFFSDQEAAIHEMIRVARPGAKLLIVDETEQGMRQYETVPGLRLFFDSERSAARAPLELVPPTMLEIAVQTISKGAFYCLTFRKPLTQNALPEEQEFPHGIRQSNP